MKQSVVADIPFALLDWDDLTNLTKHLASQVKSCNRSYDRLVALANGGLTMVRLLADELQLTDISLLQISSYSGVAEHDPEPIILQGLPEVVSGERLLIFEDIVDTGATLQVLDQYLDAIGVNEFDVATLVEKNHTVRPAEFVADRINRWIIFPYETRETIEDLVKKWQQSSLSAEQISANLLQIGFSKQQIEQFAQLELIF